MKSGGWIPLDTCRACVLKILKKWVQKIAGVPPLYSPYSLDMSEQYFSMRGWPAQFCVFCPLSSRETRTLSLLVVAALLVIVVRSFFTSMVRQIHPRIRLSCFPDVKSDSISRILRFYYINRPYIDSFDAWNMSCHHLILRFKNVSRIIVLLQ